jgi:hypothetical protein
LLFAHGLEKRFRATIEVARWNQDLTRYQGGALGYSIAHLWCFDSSPAGEHLFLNARR